MATAMAEKSSQLSVMDYKSLISNIRCQYRCPVHMDVPGYIRLIEDGKYEESYALMRETNPLPSVCGRVCFHPCESECKRGDMDTPVAINHLKRFVTDYVQTHSDGPPPKPDIKKREGKVAVIGSGPAGLTAAYDLANMGYGVTVFEREPIVGGMLRLCIPTFRLPREQIKFDLQYIANLGVEFKLNTNIGKDFTIDDLLNDGYSAAFIATGNHKSHSLDIPGEGSNGVIDCIEFLKKVNLKKSIETGANVVVVGGGSSAMDSARSAVRLGSNVTIIYRRSKSEMPAHEEEIEQAEEEGINIKCLIAPIEIISKDGKVSAIKCVEMELGAIDESGRPCPIPIPNTEFIIETDFIISAIGQSSDLSVIDGTKDISVSKNGFIEVEDIILRTSKPNIFAGGDMVTGNGIIIDAIAQGHAAAKSINSYITGGKSASGSDEILVSLEESDILEREKDYDTLLRQLPELLSMEERKSTFGEFTKCYTEDQAKTEAARCLHCDKTIEIETKDCVLCGRCANVCPMNAINIYSVDGQETRFRTFIDNEGAVRYKDKNACIKCGICGDCPAEAISMKKVVWR